jgi:hypothetical protein
MGDHSAAVGAGGQLDKLGDLMVGDRVEEIGHGGVGVGVQHGGTVGELSGAEVGDQAFGHVEHEPGAGAEGGPAGVAVAGLLVEVQPSGGGQGAHLVRAPGPVRVEGGVGGERRSAALGGGPVGEARAVRAEQGVVGRGVLGGEREALSERAARAPQRRRGWPHRPGPGHRGGHVGGQAAGAGQGGRTPAAQLPAVQLAGQGHRRGHPRRRCGARALSAAPISSTHDHRLNTDALLNSPYATDRPSSHRTLWSDGRMTSDWRHENGSGRRVSALSGAPDVGQSRVC